jgi:hypothetical protein
MDESRYAVNPANPINRTHEINQTNQINETTGGDRTSRINHPNDPKVQNYSNVLEDLNDPN